MKKFLLQILRKPIARLSERFSSRPDRAIVFKKLTDLYHNILTEPGKKGKVIKFTEKDSFIIFSDQHKGAKNGGDLFQFSESNYVAALDYYKQHNFLFINLGDCEELWENTIETVTKNNTLSFEKENSFLSNNSFVKIFGNHDLYWDNDPIAPINLERIYRQKIKVYEGAILQFEYNEKCLNIFLTHGHQGDLQSDGNWFSKWFVSSIWGPLKMYLRINLNTPSVDDHLKSLHNKLMYEWSIGQKDLLLITGHTHQPVFESLTHLERLYKRINDMPKENTEQIDALLFQINSLVGKDGSTPNFNLYKPNYFNTGCCCFDDGDITGIEISEGYIRLVKWKYEENVASRKILEQAFLRNYLIYSRSVD